MSSICELELDFERGGARTPPNPHTEHDGLSARYYTIRYIPPRYTKPQEELTFLQHTTPR